MINDDGDDYYNDDDDDDDVDDYNVGYEHRSDSTFS